MKKKKNDYYYIFIFIYKINALNKKKIKLKNFNIFLINRF